MKALLGAGRGRPSDSIVSIAAITSLALGIGAATAIFTLLNGLILRPIPVANPEQLVTITTAEAAQRGHTEQYSYATFDAIRGSRVADEVAAWSTSLLQASRLGDQLVPAGTSRKFLTRFRDRLRRRRVLAEDRRADRRRRGMRCIDGGP